MAAEAYIGPVDVQELIGDMTVSGSVDLAAVASDAASEMNIRLGERYVVPLNITSPSLAAHHKIMIKLINARLAAGNLLMSTASATEYHELHNYGKWLREQALSDLDLIATGRIVLGGQSESLVENPMDQFTGPSVSNRDEFSAVEAFEDSFLRGEETGTAWGPGGWS